MVNITNGQNEYHAYFLCGQSNMVGVGKVSELPDFLNKEIENTFIFHGTSTADGGEESGKGIWAKLRPGHGFEFGSDSKKNNYSNLFGPELSFANRLAELDKKSNIALIKYARVGTSIDSAASKGFGFWDPKKEKRRITNQFDHFLATVKNALHPKDINGDGRIDKIIPAGILWMQGESDAAYSEEIAARYEQNLSRLLKAFRLILKNENLPVVIGRISDSGQDKDDKQWDYANIVRQAQLSFVSKDKNALLLTKTDDLSYSDTAHYDTQGYIDLGNYFAEAIWQLMDRQ